MDLVPELAGTYVTNQNATCVRIASALNFDPASVKLVGPHLPSNVAMQIVEHEADVAVDVPVQRDGVDELPAARDAIGKTELIVEVHHADAAGDFPRAPAAAVKREGVFATR